MKFRYYITDLYDGAIRGTNSTDVANDYSMCEDFYVLDTETGLWLQDRNGVEIKHDTIFFHLLLVQILHEG